MCVCVYVCKRERERERDWVRKGEKEMYVVCNYYAWKRKVEMNLTTITRKVLEELGSAKDIICQAFHKLHKDI